MQTNLRLSIYFGVVPVLVFLALVFGLWLSPHAIVVFEPRYLLPAFNTTLFLAAGTIAFIAWKSYALYGSPAKLWLGCGVLALGVGALASGWLIAPFGPNVNVTIFNVGVLLAAICHSCGVLASLDDRKVDEADYGRRSQRMALAYSAVLAVIALLVALTLTGVMPAFFIQGQGPTPIRQNVVEWSLVLLFFAAVVMMQRFSRRRSPFLYWYSLALMLLAVSMLAFFLERDVGGIIGWVGRSAYLCAALYFLFAVNSARRQARSRGLGLSEVLAELFSEVHYRSLFENMLNGYAYCRMHYEDGRPVDFTFLRVNRAFESLTGLREVEGKKVSQVIPGVHESDPQLVEIYGRVALSGMPEQFETYVKRLDNWYSVSVYSPQKEHFVAVFDVITARKRAEADTQRFLKSIHAEKERLTALVNSISDEVWFADTEKRFTLANPAALREFGIDAAEKIDVKNLAASLEVYRADGTTRPVEEAPSLRALQGEVIKDCEEIIRAPATGELRHRQVSSAPVKDVNGNIIGSISVAKDITERKQAEEALQHQHAIITGINRVFHEALTCETEKQLGETCLAVVEELTGSKFGFIRELNQTGTMDVVISRLGSQNCRVPGTKKLVVPKTPHVRGIFGVSLPEKRSEIVNDPADHLERFEVPEGYPPITAFLGVPLEHAGKTIGMIGLGNKNGGYTAADQKMVEALAPAIVEAFMRKRAEEQLRQTHAELEQRVRDRTEELRLTVQNLQNEMEDRLQAEETLRGSEERFRALVTATSDVVYRMSPDWRMMLELRGRNFINDTKTPSQTWLQQYIHPDDQPQLTAAINEAIRTRSIFELEHRIQRVDGSLGWTFTRAVPLLDETGEIVEWFGAASDITARRQAEDDLHRLNQELRFLSSQLINSQEQERKRISYELHDSLGQILTVLKLHLRAVEKKLPPESEIRAELDVARNFLNQVIEDIRRISKALSPSFLEDLGLAEALEQLLKEACHRQDLECSVHLDDIDSLFSFEGQINIYRMFQEILNNILKHAGASRIELEIARLKNSIQFRVADNGNGFDVEKALDGRAREQGLGLLTIEERARILGGTSTITSKVGEGTVININIPLADDNQPAQKISKH